MSTPAEAALLREELLAEPDNLDLRRRYLACRTHDLLALDEWRARLCLVALAVLLSMAAYGVLGLVVGATLPGAVVVSAGSLHMETGSAGTRMSNHGAAVVTRGGTALAALTSGVAFLPAGAIVGSILGGLLAATRLGALLAIGGPRPWWGYCLPLRMRSCGWASGGAASPEPAPEEVFLIHPGNEAFLAGGRAPLPDRTPWHAPVGALLLAALLLLTAATLAREEPPIPQRFLEEPWRPAPWPVLAAFTLGAVVLLVRVPVLFRLWQRCRRLETDGEVVFGRVLACTATPLPAVQTESGRVGQGWQIDLHYEFTTRYGRVVADKVRFCRAEPAQEQGPAVGTPVAVLCTGEDIYEIL
jgi:hypothetical protein